MQFGNPFRRSEWAALLRPTLLTDGSAMPIRRARQGGGGSLGTLHTRAACARLVVTAGGSGRLLLPVAVAMSRADATENAVALRQAAA